MYIDIAYTLLHHPKLYRI